MDSLHCGRTVELERALFFLFISQKVLLDQAEPPDPTLLGRACS
jgi:hypothetical protein